MLNDADAKAYGQAVVNALRHIPVVVAQKYIDFAALFGAVVTHDVPRLTMDMRIAAERRSGRRPQYANPAPVFQFGPRPVPDQPREAAAPPPGPQSGPPPDMTYEPEIPPDIAS